jgi:hypothetical protein
VQNAKKGGQGGSKRRVGSRGLDKVLFLSLELDLRVDSGILVSMFANMVDC